MPNHVHILIEPRVPPPKITKSIKQYSGLRANRILGRTGAFWQDESYDHWVRTNEELELIIQYIEFNPVEAGLAVSPEEWRWSSAYPAGEA